MTKAMTQLINILEDKEIHTTLSLRKDIPCSLVQACAGLRKKGYDIETTNHYVDGVKIGHYQLISSPTGRRESALTKPPTRLSPVPSEQLGFVSNIGYSNHVEVKK